MREERTNMSSDLTPDCRVRLNRLVNDSRLTGEESSLQTWDLRVVNTSGVDPDLRTRNGFRMGVTLALQRGDNTLSDPVELPPKPFTTGFGIGLTT